MCEAAALEFGETHGIVAKIVAKRLEKLIP